MTRSRSSGMSLSPRLTKRSSQTFSALGWQCPCHDPVKAWSTAYLARNWFLLLGELALGVAPRFPALLVNGAPPEFLLTERTHECIQAGTGSRERFHTAMPPGWQVILHGIPALKLREQRMASGKHVWQGSFLCQIGYIRDVATRDLLVVRHLEESERRMQRMLHPSKLRL